MLVMGLAFWAYQENYKTQTALREARELRLEVGTAHERLTVLRAEWAYLNRPDRLRALAEMNFNRLALHPMNPDSFGHMNQVAFPPKPDPFAALIEVSSADISGEDAL